MKLRNFLYLNTKILEDYIAAIDGYTYDEESQSIAISKENIAGGKGGIPIISGPLHILESKKKRSNVL